jgi:hypothetical protein
MSFVSEFKTIIEADSSINSIVPVSRIKLSHLPEDWEIQNNWMVWDYSVANQVNSLGTNNCFTMYNILITVTTNDTVVMNTLCDYIIKYLNGKSTTNFIDIFLVNDGKLTTLTKPKNLYQNTLSFNAIFVG